MIHNSHFGFFNDSACASNGIFNFIGSIYLTKFLHFKMEDHSAAFLYSLSNFVQWYNQKQNWHSLLKTEIQLIYNIVLVSGVLHDLTYILYIYIYIYIFCKTITIISQVNIPHDIKFLFLVKIPFKRDFLSNFLIYNIRTIVTMLYITFPGLVYFITESLYLLTTFTHFVHSPTPAATNLFCFYKGSFFF